MNQPTTQPSPVTDPASISKTSDTRASDHRVELSIHLDPDLLSQIQHLTSDPSKVIEVAIRQWLKSERNRDDEVTRTLHRNPPVPPRGEWND
jgi:hypothetical protein